MLDCHTSFSFDNQVWNDKVIKKINFQLEISLNEKSHSKMCVKLKRSIQQKLINFLDRFEWRIKIVVNSNCKCFKKNKLIKMVLLWNVQFVFMQNVKSHWESRLWLNFNTVGREKVSLKFATNVAWVCFSISTWKKWEEWTKKKLLKCGWTMWTDFKFTECVENSSMYWKKIKKKKDTQNNNGTITESNREAFCKKEKRDHYVWLIA